MTHYDYLHEPTLKKIRILAFPDGLGAVTMASSLYTDEKDKYELLKGAAEIVKAMNSANAMRKALQAALPVALEIGTIQEGDQRWLSKGEQGNLYRQIGAALAGYEWVDQDRIRLEQTGMTREEQDWIG